ncbi:hypothetical protein B0O99DRAFT_508422 [Bisporella sp. PMI_857]|nr:hypothetical protein B0O99DRAFT_508422 [Bisporella sp. PMI_857]
MAGKKAAGENSKKTAGNARKAESAAQKAAVENAKKAAAEDEEWGKGAKSNAKKEAEAAKKAEQARKKAEKDALLAEEEKSLKSAPKSSKQAVKKTNKGLGLSQLDSLEGGSASSLNATGIENALDALSLATGVDSTKIDKHPERRFKAAYTAFEERRLKEMDADGSGQGLRQNQKKDKIHKEFDKSEENPFNQVRAAYDATKEDIKLLKEQEKNKIEQRLGGKD